MEDRNFAPCGLICGLCEETHEGCKGCREGGGDQNCYQLICCKAKGLDGCWQCKSFPCDNGYFVNKGWKGVIIGFAKCIREEGTEKFFGIVESKRGSSINYEEYLFRDEQDIIDMLRGTKS
ncbi:MAG TPA: DUF3795 domain-containing protein [Nitrospirae bacterium]|nr:DUF3795 domain-containing protein [Nitrospirota bacterium]HDZ03393.1 DUF3795 domain-containing protein [Nitrospirota bacterium]